MSQIGFFDGGKSFKIDKPVRLIELFAGIGSQAKALERLNDKGLLPYSFEHYRICEFDKYAVKSYNAIHGTDFETTDITQITASDLGITDTDKYCYILTYSFPCTDLSVAGLQKGMSKGSNTRSSLLWEVERLLNECKELPQVLLMENVSNILSKAHKGNFAEWKDFLVELGYFNQVYTLNASNFGSPQKRVRTYMLSVLCPDMKKRKKVEKYFKEHNLEEQPPLPRTPLINYLRVNYNIPKYKIEADISNKNDTPSRRKIFRDNDIVYDGIQCISDTVNTLTTKQDRHPTAGMVLYPQHATGKSEYRNFTPRECFLLMGFDEEDYIKASKVNSNSQLYKQAGNSIVVNVLEKIFENLI